MKVGLIPSIPDLGRHPSTGLHLILSHLWDDPRYCAYYAQARADGDYLILDNGAHELGVGQTHEDLMQRCTSTLAQEVVLPDVLFDRRATVERTKNMLKWIITDGWEMYLEAGEPRLMFVPQGDERADWVQCMKSLFQEWERAAERAPHELGAPVLGVSKDYDSWRGGLTYLIGHYVEPLTSDIEFDLHCLGWPTNLWSLASVSREFPWIRSTDSAKPFVYARNGIQLEPGGPVPKYPRRDPLYFQESLPSWQWEIAKRNVLVFQAAATDELILKN